MDALTEKGFRDFMATGVRPPVVETAVVAVVEDKPDPMYQLLTNLCAVAMLAKDLHYRAKGKTFYSLHLLSDLVYDSHNLFDEINEVYYMGECGSVPPRMAKVSAKAAELAANCPCCQTENEEDCILSCLLARCKATAGCVEDCKSLAPKSGTNAVLDEISKKMLQSVGLLTRTEKDDDAAMKYLSTSSNQERQTLDESLADHDKKYHPDGYHEGDSCNKREAMAKTLPI